MNADLKLQRKPGRRRKVTPVDNSLNQMTVHLPPGLVIALDSEVTQTAGGSRSELIREACQTYVAQRVEQREAQPLLLKMRTMTKEDRNKVMKSAAESMAEYYRTDPEIQEWQVLDGEDFYDLGE